VKNFLVSVKHECDLKRLKEHVEAAGGEMQDDSIPDGDRVTMFVSAPHDFEKKFKPFKGVVAVYPDSPQQPY